MAVVLTVYMLRLDDVAGLIGDDAWYLVLARALAEGAGPRAISSAGAAFVSQVYPPGFPAVLSTVFLLNPQFPDNLTWLKAVSVVAMIGAGLLTFIVGHSLGRLPRGLALAVALATVLTPALVFQATSTMMSEPVFLFVQLAAVLLVERARRSEDNQAGLRWAVAAGLLAGAAVLLRTAGLVVGLAGVCYLAYHRRWRASAICGLIAVCCVLPWSWYARTNAPTRAELLDHGGLMAVSYAEQFWTTEAGTVTAREATPSMLPGRVAGNLANIAIRDIGGIVVPLLFRTSSESGLEVIGLGPPEDGKVPSMGAALGTKVASLGLALIALLGFVVSCRRRLTVVEPLVAISIGLTALWPFWTFRFVLPLVPFLFVYLVTGAESLGHLVRRRLAIDTFAPARVGLMVVLGLYGLDHAQFIAQASGVPRGVPWKVQADDARMVLDWLRLHADREGAIAADNPALVYLYTGRRTIASNGFEDRWTRWTRMGVRYVVSLSDSEPLADRRAVLRFKLPDRGIWVFEILDEDQSVASSTQ